ncbi:hypothetical protein DAPPUDRAFT_305553 [Daphnia pulex]|uniref:Uncharacterized protein n=1 Tax=Daphnia pulex TaxID=6669 RepID=E9FXW4_DAPPU|nr:hypothetical protein DAPPUDRAFT_305553 [Daphnia pulex]|eukprot:EFX88173.1 hypothetical protein DAPPUDRAFT_305553 [Daphnia pulex]
MSRCKAVARTRPRRGSWGIEGTEGNPRNFHISSNSFWVNQKVKNIKKINKNVTHNTYASRLYILHRPLRPIKTECGNCHLYFTPSNLF